MAEFTLENLRQALRSAAGEDESVDLDGNILDVDFGELGYDSLAILEAASHISRGAGVTLPEDEVSDKHTPREFVDFVNSVLAAKV
jgi:act minimal PKS acyl carrier protein